MNEKAAELGLENTHYADPSGLLSENVSSAYDMARLITHVSGDERIASIMRTPEYTVHTAAGAITFRSTNHLLGRTDVEVRAGKTGFISKSGYCLATLLRLPQSSQQVAVVVLGARSNAGASWKRRISSTGCRRKASTACSPPGRPRRRAGAAVRTFTLENSERSRRRPSGLALRPTRSRAASPPRRAAASRSCRRRPGPAARRFVRRTL